MGATCGSSAGLRRRDDGAALLPVPDFWITQSIYIGLYALVALGLVLLTGVAGLTSFGQAAFVGIGAYTAAYLATQTGLPPLVTLAVGVCWRSARRCCWVR
jgi:branched-chain amino acid transport system permease protein